MPDTVAWAGAELQQLPKCLHDRPFTALLLEDDLQRDNALSGLLSRLASSTTRVVRMGSSVRSRLTLEHVLLQATGQEGNNSLAGNARQIARAIAERQNQETLVILLITQAETLHSRTLRLLQAMAPYFAESGGPTLQVLFVGRPAFRALLDEPSMTPLREALGFSAFVESAGPATNDDPAVPSAASHDADPSAPLLVVPSIPSPEPEATKSASSASTRITRCRNASFRLLSSFVIVLAATGLAYWGLHASSFWNDTAPFVRTNEIPAETQSPSTERSSALLTPPAPGTPALGPMTQPATPGRAVPSLTVGPDSPQDSLAHFRGGFVNPSATPEPRVVIHVPIGSDGAAALSAHLLTSLGPRPGTVEARRVPDTPNRPNIRYFHPDDEPVARQVAAWMADTGLPWTLRDFSTFLPRPSRGTIEVWLPR